jgi:hypothetical protein
MGKRSALLRETRTSLVVRSSGSARAVRVRSARSGNGQQGWSRRGRGNGSRRYRSQLAPRKGGFHFTRPRLQPGGSIGAPHKSPSGRPILLAISAVAPPLPIAVGSHRLSPSPSTRAASRHLHRLAPPLAISVGSRTAHHSRRGALRGAEPSVQAKARSAVAPRGLQKCHDSECRPQSRKRGGTARPCSGKPGLPLMCARAALRERYGEKRAVRNRQTIHRSDRLDAEAAVGGSGGF